MQFGVLASDCESDDEYLDHADSMINEWLTDWDLEDVMMDIFFDDPPGKKEFKKVLENILTNIEKVRKIPIERRKYDLW